ncbi:amino acid ABC transporter substrate-binding protein [Roseococcus sp. SYP-B2431]|uniref:amino acid ABC transporter substrate-binding protein n=1 Tax=Roseococcus sp. SYP-B2431 TaxID=2496640 RepID=UPI00104093DF|nr:amino acid ABC transporter substrate-binding protein [Roseococcus sp. SYP-B2431]TCH96187.1 amino acid ABC transporter substrate-binding protein [Roseococcus sp. SYP-B2431]
MRHALLRPLAAAAALLLAAAPAFAGATLDSIRRNGHVRCGVSTGIAHMSLADSTGRWQGFDAEICRAMAAAVFGDPEKVRFVPTTAQTRFTALQSGEVDMLTRTTALSISRDSTMGLTQTVAHFFTGQGILVHRRTGATKATDLDGATICGTTGSIVERNLEDFARTHNIRFRTISFETQPAVLEAFLADRCDAISNDMINLSANRLAAPDPNSLVLLPDLIQKEMHGILVRNGDAEWATLTRWTVFALIQAEEFGITRANAEEIRRTATDPAIRRFLGLVENVGTGFGVSANFAYDVVRAIGNYGELYERTAGAGGLGMERGPNRIWTQGGLLISWLWQ